MTTSTYNAGGQLTGTDASGTLTTYTYDASGNLQAEVTSAGTRSYTWDYDDRLTAIEYPDSSETNYTYNSAGQRLTKVEGGTTTRFVYDGAKVVLERDGDDETQVRYTHEGGSLYDDLLSQRRDGASYDYLLDGLASVKQVVDSSEAVENSYSYEAFGQPTVGQSDVANPYLFVGGYGVQWENTPSLYFMQARYYGPGVGRLISEDPYGGSPQDPMSLHRYLYCGNGSATRIDPEGALSIGDLTAPFLKSPQNCLICGACLAMVASAMAGGCLSWCSFTYNVCERPTNIYNIGDIRRYNTCLRGNEQAHRDEVQCRSDLLRYLAVNGGDKCLPFCGPCGAKGLKRLLRKPGKELPPVLIDEREHAW